MRRTVQIQTTSICNASCRCCPYASTIKDRPAKVMSADTWAAVMDALEGRRWQKICMYLQAEPLTDLCLEDRIREVRERLDFGELELATNCSLLTVSRAESLLDAISDTPMTWGLSFQGTSSLEFEKFTGLSWGNCFCNLMQFILGTDRSGHRRVIRSVNQSGATDFWHARFRGMKLKNYPEVHGDPGISRAGNVPGERKLLHPGPDFAPQCSRMTGWLHIAVDGKVIPCCHDYRREVILGDVAGQELDDILDNIVPTMEGLATKPDFLCRFCEQAK